MSQLVLQSFSPRQYADAYIQSDELLRDGRNAPFPEIGYYSDIENEPLHFLLDGKLVAAATLMIHGPSLGEVYKLYVHPSARKEGIGKTAAMMAIDYLFDRRGLEEVGVEMIGDSNEFWFKVTEAYGDRALYTETRSYFLKKGASARNRYPWAFE